MANKTNHAQNVRREMFVSNLAVFLLGLLMILFPAASGSIICRAIGAILLLWGIARAIAYFRIDRLEIFGSFALVQGAAGIGFGLYILLRPEVLAAVLIVVLSIFLLIGGVRKLQYGFDLARLKAFGWWVELVGAVIMSVLGIIALVNPFDAAESLMMYIGIALVVDAVWDMISMFYLSRKIKHIRQTPDTMEGEYTEK